jgi:hypothetical protein
MVFFFFRIHVRGGPCWCHRLAKKIAAVMMKTTTATVSYIGDIPMCTVGLLLRVLSDLASRLDGKVTVHVRRRAVGGGVNENRVDRLQCEQLGVGFSWGDVAFEPR